MRRSALGDASFRRLSEGSYRTTIYPSPEARSRDRSGIETRLIEYRLGGKGEQYRLLCSTLDPRRAPAIQLANLYPKRWTIETALGELKTRLRGVRVVLRSRIPALVRQEFYGLLLAHFGVRALMHEAALEEQIEANGPLVRARAPHGRAIPAPVRFFFFPRKKKLFRSLLRELAEERLCHRPNRHAPRSVKRKMTNYAATTRLKRRRRSYTLKMAASLS